MKKLSILFVFLVILPIAGCYFGYSRVSSESVPLKAKLYKEIPIDSVTIFLQDRDLPARFEKVAMIYSGYIEMYPSRDTQKWKKMWGQIRQQTAKLGCNGVYQFQDASTSRLNLPTVLYDSTRNIVITPSNRKQGIFIAIKY